MSTIKYKRIYNDPNGMRYELLDDHTCIVPYLGYIIPLKKGMKSDGATMARDLGATETGWRKYWAKFIGGITNKVNKLLDNGITDAWYGHDDICNTGMIGGRRVSNFTASLCLSLLLWKDGYRAEAFTWFLPTFIGGGGEAKKNGMFRVKK